MNDKNNESESKSLLERLLDHIVSNPFVTLWSVALIVGGLVGFIHYARLGHIPEIDVETAATVLIAVALAGAFLTLMIAVFFITPAFYLRMILSGKTIKPDPVNDPVQQAKLAERRRGGVFVARSALIAVGLWCVVLWGIGTILEEQIRYWTGLAGLVLLLTTIWGPMIVSRRRSRQGRRLHQAGPGAMQARELTFLDYVFACAVWVFILGLAGLLLGATVFDNKALSAADKVLSMISLLGVVILSNAVLATPNLVQNKRHVPLVLLIFAAAPVTVFLGLPENPVSVDKITFNNLGLGSMKNSLFLVKPEACDAINVIRDHGCIPLKPTAAGKTQDNAPQPGCVRPDSLENRIGSEFLLVYDVKPVTTQSDRKNENTSLLIPLRKDDVVLWAFGDTAAAGITACPNVEKAAAPAS